jgi:hydrogenase maturation protease
MTQVEQIADAVLYEGYMLYPYRPSVKNCQRWTFGGLYPESYCCAQPGADRSSHQVECLVEGCADATLDVHVRFLHAIDRTVGRFDQPRMTWSGETDYQPVASLEVGDRAYRAWQEAEERTLRAPNLSLASLCPQPQQHTFAFLARRWLEPIRGTDGTCVGVLVREQQEVEGAVIISAQRIEDELFKIRVQVRNTVAAACRDRDEALRRSLLSAHTILQTQDAAFVSLLDPPVNYREAAAACENTGVWPVLVGADGATDTMLASPIILYDYPQIAPESPGNLFDGCEIDEILTLRILTLTEEEKQAALAVDERMRDLLTRTEALAREQLSQLHGVIRPVREGSNDDRLEP